MSYSNYSKEPRRRSFRHFDGEQHEAACHLAGDSAAALKVFEAAMHRSKVTSSRKIKLTGDLCRQFAIDRKAKARGLTLWQAWGVFVTEQHKGKNPIVHLVAIPGRIVRQGRLRRVQISRLAGRPEASLVEFNDGTEARAGRSSDRRQLEAIADAAAWTDVELIDRGTGWLLWRLLPASDAWRPLEEEVVC
jgi:hypothetical protein